MRKTTKNIDYTTIPRGMSSENKEALTDLIGN